MRSIPLTPDEKVASVSEELLGMTNMGGGLILGNGNIAAIVATLAVTLRCKQMAMEFPRQNGWLREMFAERGDHRGVSRETEFLTQKKGLRGSEHSVVGPRSGETWIAVVEKKLRRRDALPPHLDQRLLVWRHRGTPSRLTLR